MSKFKKIAMALTVMACFAQPAIADEHTDLLDILLQKGILTKQEHEAKIKAYEDVLENKKFNQSRIDKDIRDNNNSRIAKVNDGAVLENGLGFKSKDGANVIQLTGRLHTDYRSYTPVYAAGQSTDPYQDGIENRRARFGVRGQFQKDWKFLLLANFGNDVGASSNTSTIDEFWVNYAANPQLQFTMGQFKMPFSLEQLTSSNNIDFMERSLIGQTEGEFIPAKETGFMVHGIPRPGLTWAVAASRGRGNKSATVDSTDLIGRATVNFAELVQNKDYVAHVGLGYSTGTIKTAVAPASGRTEGRASSAFFTGPALSGDTDRTRQGIEAAFAWKGIKLQGEKFNFKYDPTTGSNQEIQGHYVQAVYNLTGESHSYKDGVFGWVKPNSPYTANGGLGAWQIGVRASEFDADGIAVVAGKTTRATAITYGLTWFANDNVRVMLNYVDTKFGAPVGSSGSRVDGEKVVMLRGQLSF